MSHDGLHNKCKLSARRSLFHARNMADGGASTMLEETSSSEEKRGTTKKDERYGLRI